MWGKSKAAQRTLKSGTISTLIGPDSKITGHIKFSGGLHVDGHIVGDVSADEPEAILTLSEKGRIEGQVNVPNVILNGKVVGDVWASAHVTLAEHAEIQGDVHYHHMEMRVGAVVNGSLVQQNREPLALGHDKPAVKKRVSKPKPTTTVEPEPLGAGITPQQAK